MKSYKLLTLLISLYSINCISRALYPNKEKCVYDTYYKGTNIVITYKILDEDVTIPPNSAKTYFRVTIVGLEQTYEFKQFHGLKLHGKFAYSFEQNGKYKVCIETNDKDLFKNKKFLHLQLRVQSSFDVTDDENIAKAKDFQKVNDTMQKLNNKAESIQNMQEYQVEIEDKFSYNQIKSSSRLVYLSLCQIMIILVVGIFHVISLRKIFKEKIWSIF